MLTCHSKLRTLLISSLSLSIYHFRTKMCLRSCKRQRMLITKSSMREHSTFIARPSISFYRSQEPSTPMLLHASLRWQTFNTSSEIISRLQSYSPRVLSFKRSSTGMTRQLWPMDTQTLVFTITLANTSLRDLSTCTSHLRYCKWFAVTTIQISQPSTLTLV